MPHFKEGNKLCHTDYEKLKTVTSCYNNKKEDQFEITDVDIEKNLK